MSMLLHIAGVLNVPLIWQLLSSVATFLYLYSYKDLSSLRRKWIRRSFYYVDFRFIFFVPPFSSPTLTATSTRREPVVAEVVQDGYVVEVGNYTVVVSSLLYYRDWVYYIRWNYCLYELLLLSFIWCTLYFMLLDHVVFTMNNWRLTANLLFSLLFFLVTIVHMDKLLSNHTRSCVHISIFVMNLIFRTWLFSRKILTRCFFSLYLENVNKFEYIQSSLLIVTAQWKLKED